MQTTGQRLHVSLVAIADSTMSTLVGLHDVLNCFDLLGTFEDTVPASSPFLSEIVAPSGGPLMTASGLPILPHRAIGDVDRTDIVIIPSVLVANGDWRTGRYPGVVRWLQEMHRGGALLCSACSGVLLLAETGLLEGREATIHWAYARTFRRNFPGVHLRLEKALVAAGERQQFVMSGASASWHDLVLYLVARHLGPTAAQAIARFLLLQWHAEGQAPFALFEPPTDHGDAAIRGAQEWLREHFTVAAPVEEAVKRSGLAERSFKRRFTKATGHTPISYVQHLRVDEAKRRLERTGASVEEISWQVGYEDPASFRRLFKRLTRMTPGAYRRKFRMPDFRGADMRSDGGTR